MTNILTYADYQKEVDQISRKYPVSSIGKTAANYDIFMIKIGEGEKVIQLSAGWHGDEWLTVYYLLKLISESEIFAEFNDFQFQLIPIVNPEGFDIAARSFFHLPLPQDLKNLCNNITSKLPATMAMHRWKANALGIDPNMDFSTRFMSAKASKQFRDLPHPRGSMSDMPFATAEARAMRDIMHDYLSLLKLVICYHSQGEIVFWRNPVGSETDEMRVIAETYAEASEYQLNDTRNLHAGCRDYAVADLNIPGLTIEIGHEENPLPISSLNDNYRKNEHALKKVLKRI